MTVAVGVNAVALRHVEALVESGQFGPGDKLPTERELSAAAGVSRAVIRTALDALEDRGVVVRHVGRGTFLTPQAPTEIEVAEHPSPAEIMASRFVFEPELLPLAVGAATRADIDEMHRCLRGGEAASTSEEFERWDTLLHHSFALATHNVVLINMSRLLIDSRSQPIWGSLKRRSFNPELKNCYCTEHENIVAALEDRDPQAAGAAMHEHLRHVRTTLLGPSS
ncbi:MAG: FCD domain-containing protein [Corynebacteriales bacterium]|uniref:FCD domain-containing protein n=1 Tax=Williamsia herbipolensis TaxID=1603258 RepID=A0AAU4JZ41_9NOCA|nr:FCD domain-containing protein [Williamsia herbipolensis]MCX6471921.1 FCD domain-containing protein [Mycobacteriales bacterium]